MENVAEKTLADKYAHIKGWGIDADPENEPTYPMKNWTGDDHKRINWERVDEAIDTGSEIIAAACPFCNTMLTDGVKAAEKENGVSVLDVAELVAASME